jgi:hypothetical protein
MAKNAQIPVGSLFFDRPVSMTFAKTPDRFHQVAHIFKRCSTQQPVAQVKDVAAALAGFNARERRLGDGFQRTIGQQSVVEIPLHDAVFPHRLSRFFDRDR